MRPKTPLALAALLAGSAAMAADEPVIGLITKTETNPFFVKMKEGALAAAKPKGAKLLTGAGWLIVVSVDGGCPGVKDVAAGAIAATSQQYPLRMAAMGVEAGVDYAKTGKKPSGYTDTGVALIAAKAVPGVSSKDTQVGGDLCWGKK